MHRLFVAIRPPEPVRDLLIDAMDGITGAALAGRRAAASDPALHRRGRAAAGRRPRRWRSAACASSRSTLRIAGVGRFEQRSGGALWAGVEPRAPLAALAAKVERACVGAGLEPERRAFHPHITLARWGRSAAVSLDPSSPATPPWLASRSQWTRSTSTKATSAATARITRRWRSIPQPRKVPQLRRTAYSC